MEEIYERIIEKLRETDEASLVDIFDGDLLTRLAELDEPEYEKLVMLLQAYLIINGKEIKNINKLDTLVAARREEIERARREMPPALLSESCPDAPDSGLPLCVPSGWWMDDNGVGKLKEDSTKLLPVCNVPIYPSAKHIDHERARTLIRYAAKIDGKWRYFYVEAGACKNALVKAVKNAGILVINKESLLDYLDESINCNWRNLPAEEKSSLFEEFKSYFVENTPRLSKTKSGSWWKVGALKDGTGYIAVTPEAFRRFAKRAGVQPEHVLKTWQDEGILLSDGCGNYTKVLSLNGVRRRMVVFCDFLSVEMEQEKQKAS